jgi:cell division protein FtsQ
MDRSGRVARRLARREPPREAGRELDDRAQRAMGSGGPPGGPTTARAQTSPPASSRLTLRRTRNRRRAGSIWSRLPPPRAIADACGRAVRRSLPAVAALSVAAVVGGAIGVGHRWVTHSPRFAITEIEVRGAQRIDPDALRARLPVHVGDNAFVDLADAARAVRADPWVAQATVRRMLPHTIVVELRERVAAAIADLGGAAGPGTADGDGGLYLIDTTGRPFKRAAPGAGEADHLPIVTGLGRAAFTADPAAAQATLAEAITAVDRWRTADRPAVGEIHIDPHGAATLHTHDPAIAIQLGALADAGARMQAFDAAWAGLSDAERARTRAIHFGTRTRPDHATVAFAKD